MFQLPEKKKLNIARAIGSNTPDHQVYFAAEPVTVEEATNAKIPLSDTLWRCAQPHAPNKNRHIGQMLTRDLPVLLRTVYVMKYAPLPCGHSGFESI